MVSDCNLIPLIPNMRASHDIPQSNVILRQRVTRFASDSQRGIYAFPTVPGFPLLAADLGTKPQ